MKEFENKSYTLAGVEVRKLVANDWALHPEVWNNDTDLHSDLLRVPAWCLIPNEEGSSPSFYIRVNNLESIREPYGIVKLGETALSPNTSAHHRDIAQSDSEVIPYKKICDNPETYQMTAIEPFSQLTYTEDEIHFVEGKDGEILDIKGKLFPFAIFYHSDSLMAAPYFIEFAEVEGTYEGKSIHAIAGCDRVFSPKGSGEKGLHTAIRNAKYSPLTYVHCMLAGIRDDGKKEVASFMLTELGGHGLYWIEGEEPFMTTNVSLDVEDWQKVPYLDEKDQTYAFSKAIWHFDDKEVHFNGKWGSKGFGETPRINPEGLIEMFGTWYIGKEEYNHKYYTSFFELSRMPKDVLEDLGLKKKNN